MSNLKKLLECFKDAVYSDDFSAMDSIHQEIQLLILQDPKQLEDLHSPEYSAYRSDLDFTSLCLNYLSSNDWRLVKEKNNIKVESRGSGNEFFTRCTVLINADLISTLSVLCEIDLVPTWVDVLKEVEILNEPCMLQKLTKYHFWFPWPLSDRQCLLAFNAVPMPERHAMMITMKTPDSNMYFGANVPEPTPGEVRMKMNLGCLYAEAINENQSKIVFVVSADGNIRFLPNWLVNYGTKTIMYYLMDSLRKKIQNIPGTIYEARIGQKSEFYDRMRKTLTP